MQNAKYQTQIPNLSAISFDFSGKQPSCAGIVAVPGFARARGGACVWPQSGFVRGFASGSMIATFIFRTRGLPKTERLSTSKTVRYVSGVPNISRAKSTSPGSSETAIPPNSLSMGPSRWRSPALPLMQPWGWPGA